MLSIAALLGAIGFLLAGIGVFLWGIKLLCRKA